MYGRMGSGEKQEEKDAGFFNWIFLYRIRSVLRRLFSKYGVLHRHSIVLDIKIAV